MASHPNGVRRLPAHGNAHQRTSRTIDLSGAGPWFWSVQAIDGAFEGSLFASEQVIGQVGVAESAAPVANGLWSGGPNPFSRSTTIRFSLKERAPVSVDIFDVAGRRVRSLVDETLDAGSFSRDWDGTNGDGAVVSSGPYFVRMKSGAFSKSYRVSATR
jgi:flagellar hook assembly protein FlgD